MSELLIKPHCPWYKMYEAFGPANVSWCEEIICSYINNPANTWTNIAYLIAALGVYYLKTHNQRFTKLYGFSLMTTGLLSAFYHATNNYLTQFFDFLGMFLLLGAIVTTNFYRMGMTKRISLPFYFLFTIFCSSCFFYIHYLFPVQFMIVIVVVSIIFQEIYLYLKNGQPQGFKLFFMAIGLLAMAQAFSLIDLKRIYCNPQHHIILHGHALWHLISAAGLFVYFLFVRKNLLNRSMGKQSL